MKEVRFPNGRAVPAIGMGSWNLGQGRHPASAEEAALRHGLDLGLSLIDTAEMYGDGRSETLIGNAIAGRRDDVFLVSKVYPWNAHPGTMETSCEASLTRLNTDHLDLYLLHWRSGPLSNALIDTFEKLKAAGKIGAWGVSNFDADDMEELAALDGGSQCATDQVLYNVSSRGTEFSLHPWCRENSMPLMAYSPLGSGSDLLQQSVLQDIADAHQVTPATIALAWAIREDHVIAIPESGDIAHIEENAKALTLSLRPEELAMIDDLYPAPTTDLPLDIL
jgi:diketogulonate reductase-like aldo/keto reductase